SSSNTASNVIPIRRSGIDSNQRIGQRISASSASGQQTTNKTHQAKNVNIAGALAALDARLHVSIGERDQSTQSRRVDLRTGKQLDVAHVFAGSLQQLRRISQRCAEK